MAKPLSRAQREWLKNLGSLVGESPADVAVEEGVGDDAVEGDAGGTRKGIIGGDDKALFGQLPSIEVPLIRTRITIKNKTNVALRVVQGSAKLENLQAWFTQAPDADIGGPSDSVFSITNESKISMIPRAGGTGGEIRYDVVGDAKKAQLFMKWERGGIAPSRQTTQTITPNDGRFEIKGLNSGGDDFQFDFASKGGAPGPGPGPGPGPAPAVDNAKLSCMVTVVNQTSSELNLNKPVNERGNFKTALPTRVQPGNSVSCLFVETPGATDPEEQGCRGGLLWEVAGAGVMWLVEWDNPKGKKNTANSKFFPPTAAFESIDQISSGDDDVPVRFVISARITPDPPVPPDPPKPAKPSLPLTPEARANAEAWNRAHVASVVQFDRSTSGRYAKVNGELDADGVAQWQADHKLPPTGMADGATCAAAMAARRSG
jgi:hypothetical protein